MKLILSELFTGEKVRGAGMSAVSGTTAMLLNAFGIAVLGMNPMVSTALFSNAFGSILSYSLDILFAKRDFGLVPLPYSAFVKRARWLLQSFRRRFFYRFLITVLIESLTCLLILGALLAWMDRNRFGTDYTALRDTVASIAVVVFVFFLFGNILRFDWAYCEVEQPLLTMIVLAWVAITVSLFASTFIARTESKDVPL